MKPADLYRDNEINVPHMLAPPREAVFWIFFVFSISGWLVSFFSSDKMVQVQLAGNETLSERGKLYEKRVEAAINNPTGKNELKNIYFGIVMGLSAMIPTAVHISCALFSMRLFFRHGET